MRPRTDTRYCSDPHCPNFLSGEDARYMPDSWDEPGYAIDEECSRCGAGYQASILDYEDVMAGMLDELFQATEKADGPYPVSHGMKVDELALYQAIYKELARQRKNRIAEIRKEA